VAIEGENNRGNRGVIDATVYSSRRKKQNEQQSMKSSLSNNPSKEK